MLKRSLTALLASVSLLATGSAVYAAPAVAQHLKPAGRQHMPVPLKPLVDPTTHKAMTKARSATFTTQFHHQVAQEAISSTLNGGGTQFAVLASTHKPFLNIGSGEHSLWEMTAESLGSARIIELGWTVDNNLNGDTNPHLFVAWWDNSTFQCYNTGCAGYVDNPGESVGAGTSLAYTASGAEPSVFNQFRIERTPVSQPAWQSSGAGWQLAWKASGTDHIIGYIPDSAFSATFTKIDYIQSFLEQVEVSNTNACTDGGSGVFGTSTDPSAAARMTAYSFAGAGSYTNTPDAVFVDPSADDPTAYRVYQKPADTDYIKWGGPGWNSGGTGTGSVGSC